MSNGVMWNKVKRKVSEYCLSDLSVEQRGHLAWRLDNKTYVGYLTAMRIARLELGDLNLVDVFMRADMSEHQAKIHARKVVDFVG